LDKAARTLVWKYSAGAGVTLAVFFGGLALGSWLWGMRASNSTAPLRLYARLEVAIAATALAYFGLLEVFRSFYPSLYQADAGAGTVLLFKIGLSLLLVFPPSFFMGGTLPAIGEFLARRSADFSRTAALIYGINTFGAALGVAAAAFLLIPGLGFRLTYAVAVCCSLAVGAVAWCLARDREGEAMDHPRGKAVEHAVSDTRTGRFVVPLVAFFSGFGVLALEVLWTRMFAQVHENSVYAYAMILGVVLTCLAVGAAASARLARLSWSPVRVLGLLMLLGSVALAFGPLCFMTATDGMKTITEIESWPRFVFRVFSMAFTGIGPVVLVLGTVFPFLMKAAGNGIIAPGRTLGSLLEAFGHVSMWRNNFVPGHEIVALVGQPELIPISAALTPPPQDLINAVKGLELEQMSPDMALPSPENLPFFYGGYLTASRDRFNAYPVNTDDRPVIEYQTPRTFRAAAGTNHIWYVSPDIAALTATLLEKIPLGDDPVLAERTKANRGFALAGLAFHRAMIHKALRNNGEAVVQWREFQKVWQDSAAEP
jgi:hypothetical protein